MFTTNLKRILRTGWRYFLRNGFVSLSAVLIMAVMLFTVGTVSMMLALLDASVRDIERKIDLTVSFSATAPEANILEIKTALETLPEVASVSYVTREQALQAFRTRNQGDTLILQALQEIGENPLGATLSVRAVESSQYEAIAKFLASESALSPAARSLIERTSYEENRAVFERLAGFVSSAKRLGVAVSVILGIISVLIAFNTVRLIIYISREEISVMRLVGATGRFVRLPFVVSGLLYGAVAAALVLILFFPLSWWLRAATEDFFSGLNLFRYYNAHFLEFLGLLGGSGLVAGALSSWLAVQKYLKV